MTKPEYKPHIEVFPILRVPSGLTMHKKQKLVGTNNKNRIKNAILSGRNTKNKLMNYLGLTKKTVADHIKLMLAAQEIKIVGIESRNYIYQLCDTKATIKAAQEASQ
jgi:hypothetical protein